MTPILQAVGFGDGSVLRFKMFLDKKNADIQPAGQRFTEHELCEIMLNQLFKTSLQYISGEALTELNDAPADHTLTHSHGTPPTRRHRETSSVPFVSIRPGRRRASEVTGTAGWRPQQLSRRAGEPLCLVSLRPTSTSPYPPLRK